MAKSRRDQSAKAVKAITAGSTDGAEARRKNAETKTASVVARIWRNRVVRITAAALGSVALAYALLVASSLLPAERVNAQLGRDVNLIVTETAYPKQAFLGSEHTRDNYTDSIMLNMSMIAASDPVGATLGARYYDDPAIGPVASLAERVAMGPAAELNNGYIRYWQGYVTVLRPAALLFSYTGIRTVNAILLSVLMLACVVQIGRRINWGSAVVFALTLVLIAPPVVFNSLQFSTVLYIALAGVLAVIYLADRYPYHRWDLELFAGLGIATAYFDFLTAPILTLGFPLAVLLARRLAWGSTDRESKASDGGGAWIPAVRIVPAWGIGYIGFWAVRWVTNALFIYPAALTDIAGAIAQRAGTGDAASLSLADRFTVIGLNVSQMLPHAASPTDQASFLAAAEGGVTMLGVIVFLSLVVWGSFAALSGSAQWSIARSWPLLLVALLPIGWTLFAANHSLNHYFFTFRTMTPIVLGLGLLVVNGVHWDGVKERLGLR